MSVTEMMWLLPFIFMIHDFEEIVMMSAWQQRHAPALNRRLPQRALSLMAHSGALSPAAFALAVAAECVLLSVFSILSIPFGWTDFWLGLLLAFFIHLLVHIGQWVWFKGYTPAFLTSIFASIYCLWALWTLKNSLISNTQAVLLFTFICLLVVAINLLAALRLAKRFDAFLSAYSRGL